MVLRLLCSGVIWAQKPKSAIGGRQRGGVKYDMWLHRNSEHLVTNYNRPALTELDRAIHSQQDVVALDVPVDDLVGVKEVQGL